MTGKTAPIPKWYRDPIGLVFNELTASFLVISTFCPLMLCISGLDPANFVLPEPCGILQQILYFSARIVLASFAITQMSATVCSSHLAVFIRIMHNKSCVDLLKTLPPQRNWNPEPSDNEKTNKFQAMSDLQLYRTVSVASEIARGYGDIASVFIMGPGFFIDVTCNYVVVMLLGKIPLLRYLLIAVVDIVTHIIIMVEVPQAGQCDYRSTNLIQYWKHSTTKRKSVRRKTINSFCPVGIRVGSFFAMSRETLFSYVHQILVKTVDFILLL